MSRGLRESQDERRPNPTKGTRPPTLNGLGGIQREGRGVLDGLERRIGLWGERGVLRLGMVSEGGEYGSNLLSSFKSGRNEGKSTGK